MLGSFLNRGLVYVTLLLTEMLHLSCCYLHCLNFYLVGEFLYAGWSWDIHIQLMSALKLWKRTNQRSSNRDSGVSIGGYLVLVTCFFRIILFRTCCCWFIWLYRRCYTWWYVHIISLLFLMRGQLLSLILSSCMLRD